MFFFSITCILKVLFCFKKKNTFCYFLHNLNLRLSPVAIKLDRFKWVNIVYTILIYIYDIYFGTIYYTDSSARAYAKHVVVCTDEIDFLFVGLTIFVSEDRHITLLTPGPQENILNIITRQRRFAVSNFGIRTQFNGNVKDTHARSYTYTRTPHKHKLIRKKPST